jgi:hypothetical protein
MNILERFVSNLQSYNNLPFVILGNGDNEYYINYLNSYFEHANYFVMKGGSLNTKLDSLGLPFIAIANKTGDKISLSAALPIIDDFSVVDTYLNKWLDWLRAIRNQTNLTSVHQQ